MSQVNELAVAIAKAVAPFITDEDKPGVVALFATAKGTLTEATELMQEIAANAKPEQVESEATDEQVWGLSSCKEYYIPWCEEIHAATKTINKDGTIKKYRGIKDETFIKAEGAWLDKHGFDATEYELVDGKPVAIEGEPETTKPNVPAKPGKPNVPAKPGKPNVPAKPGKPAGEDYQAKALTEINALTNEFGVDYDFLVEQLLSQFGVTAFNDIPEEDHKKVWTEAKAWKDWLGQLNEVYVQCTDFDEEHGDGVAEGFDATIQNLGHDSMDTIPLGSHSAALDAVQDYVKQWVECYKSL